MSDDNNSDEKAKSGKAEQPPAVELAKDAPSPAQPAEVEQHGDAPQAEATDDVVQQQAASGSNTEQATHDQDDAASFSDDPPKPEVQRHLVQMTLAADAARLLTSPTNDLFSDEPAIKKKRDDLATALHKACDPQGPLRVKYEELDKSFQALADTIAKNGLDEWIETYLGDDGALLALFRQRAQVAVRLGKTKGLREGARDRAREWADRAAATYADWSAPADKIAALIGQYADKLAGISCNLGNAKTKPQAMYDFWFEVAPKHLSLSKDAVDDDKATGYTSIAAKLEEFAEFGDFVDLAHPADQRASHALFIAPDDLQDQRLAVLRAWQAALSDKIDAEAEFQLRPDDGATLKSRLDKLIQSRAADAKAILTPAT